MADENKSGKEKWHEMVFSIIFVLVLFLSLIAVFYLVPENDRGRTLVGIASAIMSIPKITMAAIALAAFFGGQLYIIKKRKKP